MSGMTNEELQARLCSAFFTLSGGVDKKGEGRRRLGWGEGWSATAEPHHVDKGGADGQMDGWR